MLINLVSAHKLIELISLIINWDAKVNLSLTKTATGPMVCFGIGESADLGTSLIYFYIIGFARINKNSYKRKDIITLPDVPK